ncbi:MAG: hypothetical protein KBD12_01830 [Candidatus Pacebacteria bacterium]|nr:hypothetical protein [Candidatus Paceibacterota bacterium]
MKKVFLFFILLFSFNLLFAQRFLRVEHPAVCRYISEMMNPIIVTNNTSISEYILYGEYYYLIYGENHYGPDYDPLLIKTFPNGDYLIMGNLHDLQSGPIYTGDIIEIRFRFSVKRIHFYQAARFTRIVWEKWPQRSFQY